MALCGKCALHPAVPQPLHPLQADSLDLADRQPAFLKDKGDAFAAQGNYM